jgi:D-alanine-D-alanine ligase
MGNITKVAVICGGSSAEREISLISGRAVKDSLEEVGIQVLLVDFTSLQKLPDLSGYEIAFIALHGHEGEGGDLQNFLSKKNIKFTGSGQSACSKTWNKKLCKEVLSFNKIATPKWMVINNLHEAFLHNGLENLYHSAVSIVGKEFFVKPAEEGSSIDIFKISNLSNFEEAIAKCTNANREFIFETLIEGKEITVSVLDGQCLPPIEINTTNKFYDYDAKYISNNTSLNEANLGEAELKEIKKMALNAFNALDCFGWARIDFMQNRDGKFFIIEINSAPGMTSHSCVPKAAELKNISYVQLVKKIINAKN